MSISLSNTEPGTSGGAIGAAILQLSTMRDYAQLPPAGLWAMSVMAKVYEIDYWLPKMIDGFCRAEQARLRPDQPPDDIYMLARLVGLDVEPALLDSYQRTKMSDLTVPIVYADVVPLDPELTRQRFSEVAGIGGYTLAHAALAIGFANYLDVDLPLSEMDRNLIVGGTASMAGNGPRGDLEIEAMAFAAFAGGHQWISPDQVKTLIASQLPDGGWGAEPSARVSNYHSTVVGLWALLELGQ